MKKTFVLFFLILFSLCLTACGKKSADSKKVVIWTSGEDYRNEYYLSECQKKFPDYDITLEYMNSNTIAAKVLEEGKNCSCDIILSEEYGYLKKIEAFLAELKDFDYSPFLDELIPASHKFTPEYKNGGCVILSPATLAAKGLSVPTSYAALLDSQYKGLISMPSPVSSGTGYMFLRQLTNEWGEDEAFAYFEEFSKNVLQYTSAGAGPVNALIQGEVAIGLGMTSQTVVEINKGMDLEIVFFDEGSPYNMYGNAVLAESAERQAVMDVFNYLATDLCRGNFEQFCPEQIFKNYEADVPGFPKDIHYGNMANDTIEEKERLQSKWTFN